MLSVRPSVIPALSYRDPRAAVAWLQAAFGFEIEFIIEDQDGYPVHSELRFGDGLVMVGSEWDADTRSPASIGRKCTQTVHLVLPRDLEAHCAGARAAGAEILQEPESQPYGDRTYRARDLEGHIWTFSATESPMTPEEWDKAMGTRTRLA
jgi:uncharacterized glyoxalase superfamily protein PhnB